MLPTPLVRPFSALRRWLRFSWLGRLPFPRTTRHASPPRKPATHQPQVEGYEDRSSFSDPSVLGAAMPLAGIGLLAAPLLTPTAILRDGWSTPAPQDPLTSTLGASPAPPAVQDLVFASWSSRGNSLDDAIEAATGRQPAGEPEFVLPPGATELVLADKGPDDTSWLDDLDGVLRDKGGKAGGTGFAGLPGLPESSWNAGGLSDGYERGGRGPLWDSSARGLEQTGNGNDNPYSYPGLFDSYGTASLPSAGGLTSPSAADTWGESGQAAAAVAPPPPTLRPDFGTLPLAFEANRGQLGPTAAHVGYLARAAGYQAFLTPTAAVLALNKTRPADAAPDRPDAEPGADPDPVRDAVRLRFVDANPGASLRGTDELLSRSNYFHGSTPSPALTDVPNYGAVVAEGVYDGIDVVYQGDGSSLRFDLRLQAGARVGDIALAYDGASVTLDDAGRLVLATPSGDVTQDAPVVYQEDASGRRQAVAGRYVLRDGNTVGFDLGEYDETRPVLIDPTLNFSSYLGGSADDYGNAIAVDAAGSVYLTGQTFSVFFGSAFPTFNGYDTTLGGSSDAFASKLSGADGKTLVYSTYVGGGDNDAGHGIAVDAGGFAHLTGDTTSTNFPTANAFQATGGGMLNRDSWVLKLSPAGNALVYSSYLGGTGAEYGYAIAVDASGAAYVTGETGSSNFPATVGSAQPGRSGLFPDGFLAKVSPSGSLVYATYAGGTGWDTGYAVAVDSQGRAVLAGKTGSNDLAVVFPDDGTLDGTADAFWGRLDPTGSYWEVLTYLGAAGSDEARAVALDGDGNVHVAGSTAGGGFATVGAYQVVGSGSTDAFLARYAAAGTRVYTTLLGGSGDETAYAVAVDSAGRAHVAGRTTSSTDFPTSGPVQAGVSARPSTSNLSGW